MEYTSPVSMWIYRGMVVIVAFGSKPLTTIMIRSKDIAESYKNYFELLWKKLR